MMLDDLSDEEFQKYIVFIDEINSFIEHITHNSTLHHNLKRIYSLLMRIIKNAHKVIVADALISDNVFNFLKCRPNNLFVKNNYKKYNGIKAHRLKDENKFKDEIEEHIKEHKPFLFGSDSCTVVEEYFYYFFDKYQDQQDKFVLFTANHKFNIYDANEQLKINMFFIALQ